MYNIAAGRAIATARRRSSGGSLEKYRKSVGKAAGGSQATSESDSK
jgi:hypothetical protein